MSEPINEANWAPAEVETGTDPLRTHAVESLGLHPSTVEVLRALKLAPGDQVVLFVSAETTREDVDYMVGVLRTRHPAVTWTVLAGAVQVMRIPGEAL